ncbi:MAG TPA: kinase [Gammaproteobacteria bacterium]|nr:kinase [Gammaproteobacteria bacterium]
MSEPGGWPAGQYPLSPARRDSLLARLRPGLEASVGRLGLEGSVADALQPVLLPLAAWLDQRAGAAQGAPVIGLCGAQGSGKSTLAGLLAGLLRDGFRRETALLSLDDFYLGRAARRSLAATVHPLLVTRGVPGTHDVALAGSVLDRLQRSEPTALPRFDKGLDERLPEVDWPVQRQAVDLVLFEGWCIGARPEPEARLRHAINALERDEDPDAAWRAGVNAALAGSYAALFRRLDRLVMLRVPDWDSVRRWRAQQEESLPLARRMDGPALRRFLMHYERLTRWMLEELPQRADVTLGLRRDHRFGEVRLHD